MGEECARYRRPLKFVPGVEKAVRTLPSDVQDVFGKALMDAQYGDQVPGARPFGEGVPRDVLKLVEDDDRDRVTARYRAAAQDYATNKATYLAATASAKDEAVAKAAAATLRSAPVQKRGKQN